MIFCDKILVIKLSGINYRIMYYSCVPLVLSVVSLDESGKAERQAFFGRVL